MILYLTMRTFVLRSENSLKRSMVAFPLLVTATIAVNGEFGSPSPPVGDCLGKEQAKSYPDV